MVCEQCLVQVTRYVNSKEKISSGLWAISLSLFSSLHPKRQFNELFNLNIWGKSAQQLPLTAFLWPLCQVEDGGKQMIMLEYGAICNLMENHFQKFTLYFI